MLASLFTFEHNSDIKESSSSLQHRLHLLNQPEDSFTFSPSRFRASSFRVSANVL